MKKFKTNFQVRLSLERKPRSEDSKVVDLENVRLRVNVERLKLAQTQAREQLERINPVLERCWEIKNMMDGVNVNVHPLKANVLEYWRRTLGEQLLILGDLLQEVSEKLEGSEEVPNGCSDSS